MYDAGPNKISNHWRCNMAAKWLHILLDTKQM